MAGCGSEGDIYRFSLQKRVLGSLAEDINRAGVSGYINSAPKTFGFNRRKSSRRGGKYGSSKRGKYVKDLKLYIYSMVRGQRDSILVTDLKNNLICIKPTILGAWKSPKETLIEPGNPGMKMKHNGKMLRTSPDLQYLAVKSMNYILTVFKLKDIRKFVEATKTSLPKVSLKYSSPHMGGHKQFITITDFDLSNSTAVAITKKGFLLASGFQDDSFTAKNSQELNEAELELECGDRTPFFNSVAVSDCGEYVAVGLFDKPHRSRTTSLFITLVKCERSEEYGEVSSLNQLGTIEEKTQAEGKKDPNFS